MNGRQFLKATSIFFGVSSFFIYFGIKWLTKSFGGGVSSEQILWNATNNTAGVDFNIVKSLIKCTIQAFFCSSIWFLFIYKFEEFFQLLFFTIGHLKQAFKIFLLTLKKWSRRIRISHMLWMFALASVVIFCVQIQRLNKHTQLHEFLSSHFFNHSEDFISKNSYFPKIDNVNFAMKKDLVVVLAESLEQSFYDPKISTKPLASRLRGHYANSLYTNNMVTLKNLSWTIAAVTGWHFGLPLKLPPFIDGNNYHSKRGFLPGAQSIFEIFKKNGYTMVLILGSDSDFSGQRTLFTTHGGFKILDKKYWQMQGWSLNEHGGTGWGFSDEFILDRAYEEYKKLKKENVPFVLFVETVDTHAPEGYTPSDKRKYGDIRDPFAHADELLNNFANQIKKFESSNTALAVIGDHYFMGNPPFLPDFSRRRIFNLFWSSDIKKGLNLKEDKNISALDIAPTLLELAGGRWDNHKYGLGVSIFSAEPNLIERYGLDTLNQNLNKPSNSYNSFY